MAEKKDKQSTISTTLSRRQFIKGGLATASLGAMGAVLPGCSNLDVEVLKQDYPDIPENKVSLPPNGKSVLILGGGFGGMHAACELLDRGFDVTVIEKSNLLGGKLKSIRDMSFGVPPKHDLNWKGYPRDHGAHAVWGFYNNLREFMGRHGYRMHKINREKTTFYNFIDKDGGNMTLGFPPASLPGILGEFERRAGMLGNMNEITGKNLWLQPHLWKMMAFDFNDIKQRQYLDSVSMPQWAREVGISRRIVDRLFGPLSEMAMFDAVENTSALYLLMLLSCTSGTYEDLCIDIFLHPPGETYIKPIELYIKAKGGKILFNTPVIKVNQKDGKITSVLTGYEEGKEGAVMWKCNVCGAVFHSPSKPGQCPVCGAPSNQIMMLNAGPPKEYSADYYVVAMDTPGAQQVILKSMLKDDGSYFKNIFKIEKTDVYVVNIWYSNCDAWERRFPRFDVFMPSGFKLLGVTLNWAADGKINGERVTSPLVPDYQEDYVGEKINVIETQVANTDLVKNMTDEQIVSRVHEELKVVIPDLPEPTNFYINKWDTYSPQRVGYEAIRPQIQSPIDNLFFIGDWVKTNHESVYMEKTNVASKMVTNMLLDKIGQKEGKIKILPSGTPNKIVNLTRMLYDVYP